MKWYLMAFKKYAVFSGRASRKEFWMFTLINMLIVIIGNYIPLLRMLTVFYLFATFTPNLAISIRRLHDTNKSGWWMLVSIIPWVVRSFISTILLIRLNSTSFIYLLWRSVVLIVQNGFAMFFSIFSRTLRGLSYGITDPLWWFSSVIPLIGIIWLSILLRKGGTPGMNKYGPNPLETSYDNQEVRQKKEFPSPADTGQDNQKISESDEFTSQVNTGYGKQEIRQKDELPAQQKNKPFTHPINNLHPHNVTLKSFYIGMNLVTQSEYKKVMGINPAVISGFGDNYPVYNVSWYDAIKFCNLLSIKAGLIPVYSINGSTNPANWGFIPRDSDDAWNAVFCNWKADGYRLPTEAEWEYAARGGTNKPDYLYSGSDNIDEVAWYGDNNTPYGTKPVGGKAPNGLGIYDMSGNLYEWCWDWYDSSYYSNSPSSNPKGPSSGFPRVIRGGFWSSNAEDCRVASRNYYCPNNNSNRDIGFRLCRNAK